MFWETLYVCFFDAIIRVELITNYIIWNENQIVFP